jgi:UDP-glucose 4-epimerase
MSRIKVVVTGGAGFIGSHIVEYWSRNGAEVHVIDNLRTGKSGNIEGFENVHLHNVSITDRNAVFEIMEGAKYLHHLAALVSVPESLVKPFECVQINVIGLLNILDAAAKHKVVKVVHSSSAAIYGDNPESPKRVNMLPMPKTPYGITKLDGEYYLHSYRENFGVNTVSLRYFNVFGPRQDPASQYAAAVPIFIKRAIEGKTITIYGDGEQTRDFVYVKDVVNANILAATKLEATGVFNVALGHPTSINELANEIIRATGSKSSITHTSERPGDIKDSLASISETINSLGFKPQFSLREGLKETVESFSLVR